ncbi:MAG: imidazole glycerol phosphate synthase subunit HisF [Candidatus Marinimicrobia bacterium]|nr:imidazole glycerol phosphate synthase subunit HisF [Candidatus Neomarinimicrobiota bacterium]MCF7827587.1 imidazole glycerol phosphate synthase subunit HisF [Candidatus Neomarinimicrobiota bacterium]MCF7881551.1 imidazole glycerol phosphate synthase subunit HisF [Candidatus Neomarinimicrobiota bacterium]
MLTKRIIPCLDIKDGRVVKGTNFKQLRDAGDPVELGKRYNVEGADELVFLDITASEEKRKLVADLASRVAKEIFIPFTIGGGIKSVEDMNEVLQHGADKVAINTAAVKTPELIREGADKFGSQCIVVALDVKRAGPDDWRVYIYGGKKETELNAIEWAKRVVDLGAGEILLTSMDSDGTRDGFDVEITRKISEEVPIPVIASGGGGEKVHFLEAITRGKADAVLAASVFHYDMIRIEDLKQYLINNDIPIREFSNGKS